MTVPSRTTSSVAVVLERHLAATLDMLAAVIDSTPDGQWDVRDGNPPVWQQVYHCVSGLDFWLRDPGDAFVPPPFHTEAAGMLAADAGRPIDREELREYLEALRARAGRLLLEASASGECLVDRPAMGIELSLADRVLDQIRHVQHHVGAMGAQLRRRGEPSPGWQSEVERRFRAAKSAG